MTDLNVYNLIESLGTNTDYVHIENNKDVFYKECYLILKKLIESNYNENALYYQEAIETIQKRYLLYILHNP
jgi:hypothetical protein